MRIHSSSELTSSSCFLQRGLFDGMSSTSYSSTLSSASTAAVTSSATAISSTHTHDERTLILGVTLGVVGFLLIVVIIVATFRFQRANPGDSKSFSLRATVIDRSHPAARITPFGAPGGEIPRFGFGESLVNRTNFLYSSYCST